MSHPAYAMVSVDIRRDLVAPLTALSRLRLLHFYQRTPYGDLADDEYDDSLRRYTGPLDLAMQLWRERPDVIQGIDPFVLRLLPLLYATFAVALLRHVPLVIATLENRPLDQKYHPALAALLRLALRPVFAYATVIVYVNEGARRNLLSVGPYTGKLRPLMFGTWGIDPHEFSPEGHRVDLGPRPALLFIGRIDSSKGVFDLADALALLRADYPTAQLTLIGSGPDRERLERRVAELGLEDAVILAGTVLNRDLPGYLRGADVFLAPSRTTRKWEEQVGMSIIQALSCGVPVVATRSGAIPEYLPEGEAGLLVPEGDPRALAGATAALLASPALRERLAQAGWGLACAHYDAASTVRAAEDMILGVAAGRQSQR